MTDDGGMTPIPVPPVGHERHWWRPGEGLCLSRSARRRETGEYESTVPCRLADLEVSVPAEVGADLEEAAKALADFDSYAGLRLGSRDQMLGPMSAILLRTESTSSSQIENLTVGARRLALQELGEEQGGNARVVVGNVQAMESALQLSEDLDERHLLAMHRALLEAQEGFERYAGRYRDELVWVGGSSHGPIHATHVGPRAELIAGCMDDLFRFIGRDDLPALVQCAIAHAQFETIHPFADGNGRVGRALVQAMLRHMGLVRNITPPVSAGLLTDTRRYFAALGAYRAGDARPIVDCFLDACRFAAGSGTRLIDDLAAQLDEAGARLEGVRRDAAAFRVLPLLVPQPIVNVRYVAQALAIPPVSATRALDTLVEHGVLVEATGGKRNRVWEHKGILAVLDSYAASLRRR